MGIGERIPAVISLLDLLPNGGGSGQAFESLTLTSMKSFNESTPDDRDIKYFSWGAVAQPGLLDPFRYVPFLLTLILVGGWWLIGRCVDGRIRLLWRRKDRMMDSFLSSRRNGSVPPHTLSIRISNLNRNRELTSERWKMSTTSTSYVPSPLPPSTSPPEQH